VLSTLDQERIVDVLVGEVMRLKLFRSMVVELVDMDRGLYEMLRAYHVPGIKYLKDMEVDDRAQPYEVKEETRGEHLFIGQDALRRDVVAQKETLVMYQPCTPMDCPMPAGYSLIDAAFSHGTLAINSSQKNAFTAWGIELVERLAVVLSEGLQRVEDLEARERTDWALHEQNELLTSIVEDYEGRRILVNPTLAAWFGQALEELLGKKNKDLYPADFAHKLDSEDRRVMESAEVEVNENIIPSSHGPRYVQTHKYPLRDEKGEVRGLIGIGRDITEIRRREMLVRAVAQVRDTVWEMGSTEGVRQVVKAVHQGLRGVGIDFAVCGVNIVEANRDPYEIHAYNIAANDEWTETIYRDSAEADTMYFMWEKGGVHYRPDL
jgi:PAS domain S-box-containing protein